MKTRIYVIFLFVWWCHQESNRGHKDFQSFALPTELWHQHSTFQMRVQRYSFFLYFLIVSEKKHKIFGISLESAYLCTRKTAESSAVGSALRSGRRGRAFESPLSDRKRWLKDSIVAFFFFNTEHKDLFLETVVFYIVVL